MSLTATLVLCELMMIPTAALMEGSLILHYLHCPALCLVQTCPDNLQLAALCMFKNQSRAAHFFVPTSLRRSAVRLLPSAVTACLK